MFGYTKEDEQSHRFSEEAGLIKDTVFCGKWASHSRLARAHSFLEQVCVDQGHVRHAINIILLSSMCTDVVEHYCVESVGICIAYLIIGLGGCCYVLGHVCYLCIPLLLTWFCASGRYCGHELCYLGA